MLNFAALRHSEWICVVYFAYISFLSFSVKVPQLRRLKLLIANVTVVIAIFLLPAAVEVTSVQFVSVVRDWLPALLILLGYYESGCLTFPRSDQFFEKAFLRWDEYVFRIRPFCAVNGKLPGWLGATLEFMYLQCYVIVPSGIAALYLAHERSFTDWYWGIVLPAVFVAYGLTPLFPAQPPRKLPQKFVFELKPSPLRRLNLWIHDHASIKVNTFPSGHVAAAVAVSLALTRPLPAVGICYMIIALGIFLGAVRGRYHYALDAVAGATVAVAAYLSRILV